MRLTLASFLLTILTAIPGAAPLQRAVFFSQNVPATSGSGPATFNTASANGTGSTIVVSGVNTTGAKAIAVVVSWYSTGQTITVTHAAGSDGNATALSSYNNSGAEVQIYYWLSPTTGSSDTFTATFSGTTYGTAAVIPMKGITGNFDSGSGQGGGGNSTTCQASSSISPASGHLVIAGLSFGGGSYSSIGSSFSMDQNITAAGGSYDGIAAAHLVSTGSAINPTWTISAVNGISCALASFN